MAVRIPNTLGLEACTDNWFEYADAEQLEACLAKAPKPWLPVGAGSNLLFSKPTVEGSVFRCTDTSWEAPAATDMYACVSAQVCAGTTLWRFVWRMVGMGPRISP